MSDKPDENTNLINPVVQGQLKPLSLHNFQ